MNNRDYVLFSIWLAILESSSFTCFKENYMDMARHLNTSSSILTDLRIQLLMGNLVIEQVVYHLIKDWFIRTENASLVGLLKALANAGWGEVLDELNLTHQSNSNRKTDDGKLSLEFSRWIGQGRFGTSLFKRKSKNVAVKKSIYSHSSSDKILIEEAKQLVNLVGHENIAKYYCDEEVSGFHSVVPIALELFDLTLKMSTLTSYLLDFGISVKNVLIEIPKGVDCLHKNKIIQRDIKPENMMVILRSNSFKVKLCDFGISKKILDESRTAISLGSESFACMAP